MQPSAFEKSSLSSLLGADAPAVQSLDDEVAVKSETPTVDRWEEEGKVSPAKLEPRVLWGKRYQDAGLTSENLKLPEGLVDELKRERRVELEKKAQFKERKESESRAARGNPIENGEEFVRYFELAQKALLRIANDYRIQSSADT